MPTMAVIQSDEGLTWTRRGAYCASQTHFLHDQLLSRQEVCIDVSADINGRTAGEELQKGATVILEH